MGERDEEPAGRDWRLIVLIAGMALSLVTLAYSFLNMQATTIAAVSGSSPTYDSLSRVFCAAWLSFVIFLVATLYRRK